MQVATYIVWAMATFFVVLRALRFSGKAGIDSAAELRLSIAEGKSNLREIKLNGWINCLYGFPVVCNSDQCAYLIGSRAAVINYSDIEWVQTIGRHRPVEGPPEKLGLSAPPPAECELKNTQQWSPT